MLTKYLRTTAIMIVLVGAILLPICKLNAQSGGSAGKMAQAMTDSLGYLQLTDQQKNQALVMNDTAAGSLIKLAQKAKQDTSFKGKALAKQVMGVMKQRNAALSKILTPDQQKLFQEHKLERIAELQTKVMTTQLDLTEQQIPQVYQLNLKGTSEMMADKAKLEGSKRKLAKLRAAKGMKSDSKEEDEAFKKILSEDQYDKYEKNKEAMQEAMKKKKG